MSRILAELLGSTEPSFRLSLKRLEEASGSPAVDIRLASEIEQQTQEKMRELGLDPFDTDGPELYAVLSERLKGDNQRLEKRILGDKQPGSIAAEIVTLLQTLDYPKSCFAIKHSVAKRLLKKVPPKASLRLLGYRSLDSMLKREPAALVLAVAVTVETSAWHDRFIEQYRSLRPGDFESRDIEILCPLRTLKWEKIARHIAEQQRSTVMVCKELGALIILPMPSSVPLATITSMVLALEAVNDIRLHSAFCKLQQVKPDFGAIITATMQGDVRTLALMAGQPLPWHIIQKYYSRFTNDYPAELIEPHVQPEDLQLVPTELVLSEVEPTLEFWHGTSLLGLLSNHQVTSLNIADVAVSICNSLAYSDRLLHYLRDNIWNELLLRYLQQKYLGQGVLQQLDSQLIDSTAEAPFTISLAGAS